jgi:hypothetical protein
MPDGGVASGPMMAAMLGSSAIGAGGSILGGLLGQSGAKSAVNAETNMFNTAANYAAPFIGAGKQALSPLMKLITPGADQSATLAQTPGYQFALSQGEKGVTNQATMGGLGGNVLRAGAGFATGLAQNTWQNVVQALQNAASMGAGSASSLAGNATQMGGTIGSTMMGGTNLGVGGLLGAAGSIGSGMNNAGILSFLSQYLKQPQPTQNTMYAGANQTGLPGNALTAAST